MNLTTIDWLIIGAYFAISLGIGLYYYRRAGESTGEFFVAGRSLPWWLAGTSMVATTFAADTPLAVTEMVARNGVAGNWLWWSMLPSGMLTVFFFARLWRRAEVMTDVEFVELRYAGPAAAFLRGFRALYLGLAINLIIMGWVNLGMAKVLSGTLGLEKWEALGFCLAITFLYSVLSGLWGVVVTDAVQFVIAIVGSIALAYFAVDAVGGLQALKDGLATVTPAGATQPFGEAATSLWPDGSALWMLPMVTLVTYLAVNWWASWYPGAEPGGGGYVAQRIFSARTERDGVLATLWFNVAHYALRPWPWILVALCSVVLYENNVVNPATGLVDPAFGYVRVMNEYLPAGFRGLLLASFAAAYMSTISTQMNWGSSYIVNDFYRRFIRTDATERHYVFASRVATFVTMCLSIVVTYFMNRITSGWELVLTLGAGTGLVYILRWYWWRINAWSEICRHVGGPDRLAGAAVERHVRRGHAHWLRADDADDRGDRDGGVADGDLRDRAGTRRHAARLLSARAPRRSGLGADRRPRRGRQRPRAGAARAWIRELGARDRGGLRRVVRAARGAVRQRAVCDHPGRAFARQRDPAVTTAALKFSIRVARGYVSQEPCRY